MDTNTSGIVDIQPDRTYKIKAPVVDHAIYFTICGYPAPLSFFINSKNMDSFQWIISSVTAFSRLLQAGVPVEALIHDMKNTFDPKGDYIIPDGSGIKVNSLVHHLGLKLEQHMLTIKEELKMSETNFLCVKRWMETVKQDVPAGPIVPIEGILELRKELIKEEGGEAQDAISDLLDKMYIDDGEDAENTNYDPLDSLHLLSTVKELADLLVVTYGAFVAIGVDGDKAMNIIMRNNFGKVEKGTFREDGKLVVDADTKAQLKKEVNAKLTELLSHGA